MYNITLFTQYSQSPSMDIIPTAGFFIKLQVFPQWVLFGGGGYLICSKIFTVCKKYHGKLNIVSVLKTKSKRKVSSHTSKRKYHLPIKQSGLNVVFLRLWHMTNNLKFKWPLRILFWITDLSFWEWNKDKQWFAHFCIQMKWLFLEQVILWWNDLPQQHVLNRLSFVPFLNSSGIQKVNMSHLPRKSRQGMGILSTNLRDNTVGQQEWICPSDR